MAHIKFLWLLFLILHSSTLWPQQGTDTLLKEATQQIYENPARAIELANRALEISSASADKRVEALLVISTAYSSKRDYEKSLEFTLRALDLLPKLTDVNLKINLLNRIGGQYQELKIYDKSIAYLDRAKQLIESVPDNEVTIRGMGYNNLVRGFIYREQMSCDIALNYFGKAIADYEKIPNHPAAKANISTSYYNRGNCLISLGKLSEAEDSFLQAVAYAKKIDAKSLVAFAQKGLAEVYTAQDEYGRAIELLTEALQNSENVGDKVLNRAIYDALATNYLETGDLFNYFLYKDKNMEVHQQITRIERQTVDNSIKDLMDTNAKAIGALHKKTKIFQWILSFFLIMIVSAIIIYTIKAEKRLQSLKRKLRI